MRKISGLTKWVSLLVLSSLLLAFPSAVFAQTPEPPVPTADPARAAEKLEKLYEKEQKALQAQTDRLAKADGVPAKVQERINKLKEAGKDTAALEKALVMVKEKLALAHQKHDAAAAILGTHAGFDAAGKVTDREQARETLRTAGENLQQAHKALREGAAELRKASKETRKGNRPDDTTDSTTDF